MHCIHDNIYACVYWVSMCPLNGITHGQKTMNQNILLCDEVKYLSKMPTLKLLLLLYELRECLCVCVCLCEYKSKRIADSFVSSDARTPTIYVPWMLSGSVCVWNGCMLYHLWFCCSSQFHRIGKFVFKDMACKLCGICCRCNTIYACPSARQLVRINDPL